MQQRMTRFLCIRRSRFSICLVLPWPTFLINTKEAPGERSQDLASNRLLKRMPSDSISPNLGVIYYSVSQAPHSSQTPGAAG